MKYLVLIITFLFFLSCEKEPVKPSTKEDNKVQIVYLNCNDEVVIENVGARQDGEVILYLNTLSTTNVLLGQAPRVEEIYNQKFVKHINFEPTGVPGFGQSGIFHHRYFAKITFANDSMEYRKVAVGYTNGQPFEYVPVITNNLISAQSPYYKVTYVLGRSKPAPNVLRGVVVNLSMIDMYYNGDYQNGLPPVISTQLQPVHKGTNVFTPSHKY